MRLSLLGPPGSGKGVYAERLGEDFRVQVVSVGDILREKVENKSEVGLKAKKYMDKGELVPNDIILKIVNERIYGKDNLVLDGFPRGMGQININVDKVIFLKCSDEICIDRIISRVVCPKCKKIYNLITLKPVKEGICDKCGSKLSGRGDKNVVKDRLKVFKRETLPVVNYFKKEGILEEVDGERSIDKVYRDIRKLFKLKE